MRNEIEVTPEMIEAGVEALAGSQEPDGVDASELVATVYRAMESARRAPRPQRAA